MKSLKAKWNTKKYSELTELNKKEKLIMDNETKDVEVVEEVEETKADEATETDAKAFTQQELDDIIESRLSRERKKHEKELESAKQQVQKELDEAEKLKQMNVEQKAHYEKEQSEKRIQELEAELNRHNMEREASTLLAEHDIVASGSILNIVVRNTAEDTQKAIDGFVEVVNDLVDKKVSDSLKGNTTKRLENASNSIMTKDAFNKLAYKEKVAFKRANPKAYDQLSKE